MDSKQVHPTKKGPGRRHGQGVKKAKIKRAPIGAGPGFVQRAAPNEKRVRRALIAAMGRRQLVRAEKVGRREAKARAEQ